jgi:hypothetical protein
MIKPENDRDNIFEGGNESNLSSKREEEVKSIEIDSDSLGI